MQTAGLDLTGAVGRKPYVVFPCGLSHNMVAGLQGWVSQQNKAQVHIYDLALEAK